jgi:LmbE family N-acetylglucosaminyl deacetylase
MRFSSDYETAIGAGPLLVVAAHPDDESIGCGGLIAMARRLGVDVQIAFVTLGEASHQPKLVEPEALKMIRRNEACEAAARLGVPQTALHFLGIPDGRVHEHRDEIVVAILKLIEEHKPQAVFLPHAKEPPSDHYLTYAFGRMALDRWARQVRMFEYGVWYWQHWPWVPLQFSARANSRLKWRLSMGRGFGVGAFSDYNCRLDISEVLPFKRRAIEAHASQFGGADFPRGWPVLGELEGGLIAQSWLQPVESFRRTRLAAKLRSP